MKRAYAPLLLLLLASFGPPRSAAQMPAAAYGSAPTSVASVEAELSDARAALSALRASSASMVSENQTLETRAAELKERVRRDARALYRMRRSGPIRIDGGIAGMLARLSRVSRFERVLVREAQESQRAQARSGDLARQVAQSAGSIRDAEARVEGLTARKAALETQARESLFAGGGFGSLPIVPLPSMPDYGSLRVVGGGGLSEFAERRGRLTLPVAGAARFVDSQLENGPALRIEASASSGVRAVAPGRVAFVGRQQGMGLVVILEHPGGFFSVYAGLGAAGLSVGDGVGAGASLGHATLGGQVDFQIRRGTRALDPRSWLGL